MSELTTWRLFFVRWGISRRSVSLPVGVNLDGEEYIIGRPVFPSIPRHQSDRFSAPRAQGRKDLFESLRRKIRLNLEWSLPHELFHAVAEIGEGGLIGVSEAQAFRVEDQDLIFFRGTPIGSSSLQEISQSIALPISS